MAGFAVHCYGRGRTTGWLAGNNGTLPLHLQPDEECQIDAARSVLHSGIENEVYWVVDVTFREDDSRIRWDNGAKNSAVLRHIAPDLLKRENSAKLSLRAKRHQAAWDNDYRLKVPTG